MCDMIDLMRDLKKIKQEHRGNNRELAPELLKQAGISFESKNLGAHLIVSAGCSKIDFWPGTEKWISRGSVKKRGFGIESLIKQIEAMKL